MVTAAAAACHLVTQAGSAACRVMHQRLKDSWLRVQPAIHELLQASGAREAAEPTFQDWLWAYTIFW